MSLAHRDAADLLEAYVLDALPEEDDAAVAAHLVQCATCREEADRHAKTVDAISASLPEREPSPALRAQILAAASGDVRRKVIALRWRPAWTVTAALAVALAAGGVALVANRELQETARERDEYLVVARAVSEGWRWWPMAATPEFEAAGGSLIVSRRDAQAFVLFHDLRPAPNARYAVWLIRSDGSWVRAANFVPAKGDVQRVDLAMQVTDFVQCAVTLERAESGKREGPLVMQSRVFSP